MIAPTTERISLFSAAAKLVRPATTITIITHVSPDGDALGSALGLAWGLRKLGKQCAVVCPTPTPPSLAFIPGSAEIISTDIPAADLTIIVDCSDLQRLDHLLTPSALAGRTIIDIDHHVTNLYFGQVNIVDAAVAAAGEIIYDFLRFLNVPIDPDIATCLLTAIVTDSISFRTSSTTPDTLRSAADLMEAGANMVEIAENAFERRPLPVMRMWGEVLNSFTVDHGMTMAVVTQEMLGRYGLGEDDVKGLVNLLRSIAGTKVAVLVMEATGGKVKVEFRSDGGVDVSAIALGLGGGGHKPASGATVAGPLPDAIQQITAAVESKIGVSS